MRFSSPRRDLPLIEMTPLIDILFQLLIFFMVSTTFRDAPGIDIELPEASTRKILHESQDIEILIDVQGQVWMDQEALSVEKLQDQMQRALQTNPNVLAIVKADRKVEHEKVVQILDLAQQIGIRKLSIQTSGQESSDNKK